jgi:RTX calcium-binding nonapeptide repeat (4 copies)
MLACGCLCWTRMLVGVLALLSGVGAAAAVVDDAQAGLTDRDRLAIRLLRLDPGALVGGNTQVASVAGARLVGVPGRTNFILGLGARQRIVGGRGHDQLGARGAGGSVHGGTGHDLIHGVGGHDRLHGGHGHDLIHGGAGHDRIVGGIGHDLIRGGPGHDRLHGGPGDDRFIDRQGNTVMITGPGTNHVDVADGSHRDRVHCSPGSTNRIVVDRGDRLHPRCRSQASIVLYRHPPSQTPTAHTAQNKPVTGDGTNDDPFIAACDNEKQDICVVSSFPGRSLSGLWSNEYVPAYKCPASHPYLYAQNYAPFGTSLPKGVEVAGLGPIGVSITGRLTVSGGIFGLSSHAAGTRTGGANSSATSWSLDTNSYQVKLHCAKNVDNGYPS